MRRLLVLGSAPCMERDIESLDLSDYEVAAVNRAMLRYMGDIKYLATYHPQAALDERWRQKRIELGGNGDFETVLHHKNRWYEKTHGEPIIFPGPGQTGSSTLLAVLFGLQAERYDSVLVAGAPMVGPYDTFQAGWIQSKRILAGRVASMSGWTKTFLEGLQ